MRLFEQLRTLKQEFFYLFLEPERADAWVSRLRECAVAAAVEWRPRNFEELAGRAPGCIGRIRLDAVSINAIEIVKGVSSQEGAREGKGGHTVYYEDHFLIQTPERGVVTPVGAKRAPLRKYWVFGPIRGYRWRGGPLAERLAADAALEAVLAHANEGAIAIYFDKKRQAICIRRRYSGTPDHLQQGAGAYNGAAPGGLAGRLLNTFNIRPAAPPDHGLPSRDLMGAYLRIAETIRAYAGLPAT